MSRDDYNKLMSYLDELQDILVGLARDTGQGDLASTYFSRAYASVEKIAAFSRYKANLADKEE
jgi:hypothetical protein